MGHVDPKLTLTVYAREVRRKDGERERLRALVEVAADSMVCRLRSDRVRPPQISVFWKKGECGTL